MGKFIKTKRLLIGLFTLLSTCAMQSQNYDIKNPIGPEVLKERIRASYGFLSQREPALNTTEYAIIDKFLPFLEEDPDFAIEMIKGLTANNPNLTASFNLTLGNLYFQTGDLQSARKSYGIAVEKYPDYLRAWKAIGLLEMHQQDYTAAKKSLGNAVRLGDSDPDTFGLIAYAFYVEEDFLAALSAYSHALLFAPTSEDWIQGKVACLLRLNDYLPARTILEATTRKHPKNPKHWTVLANIYIKLKEPLKAAAVLEYLRSNGMENSDHLNLLTSIYLDNELPELAARIFLDQLEQRALPPADKLIACLFQLSSSGQSELADTLIETAEQSVKLTAAPAHRFALLRYQGDAAMRAESYIQADVFLKEALELTTDRGPVILQRGIVHYLAKNHDEAIALLEEAAIYPSARNRALTTLAQILMQAGEYQAALNHLQIAIDEDPSPQAEALYAKALHAARRQELDRMAFRNIQSL